MPFLFDFYLNNTRLENVESGFSTSRKWEEALDEARFALPFYDSEIPVSQYGLLQIYIQEVDSYEDRNIIESRTMDMLITSDRVNTTSQYGVYRHEITAIEYTAKLDAYIMASLAKTRSIESVLPASFEITTDGNTINRFLTASNVYTANVWLPPFTVFQTYFVDKEYTFSVEREAYQLIGDTVVTGEYIFEYTTRPVYMRYTNEDTSTTSSWLDISTSNQNITFTTKGNYSIEYGFDAEGCKDYLLNPITDGIYAIMKFYFRVIDDFQVTVGDLVETVRRNVSKYGGVESKLWFDSTRIFEIDSTISDFLYSIPAPQMYLEQATARQMLIFALSYVNSLPRLEYGSGLDTLGIEQFNLETGSYEKLNIAEQSGHQNTNQIGSRGYGTLKQVLPNNTGEPTIYAPSQDDYLQVRASNLQLTDSTFEIKLPKPIYTPKDFSVYVPDIEIEGVLLGAGTPNSYNIGELDVPLTSRLINIEEWKLKEITDNFPTTTTKDFWDTELGLRNDMVENLYWELGSKKIAISDVYGTLVNQTLVQNVIKMGIYEYLMLNMFDPVFFQIVTTDVTYLQHYIDIDLSFLSTPADYRDLRFRFSYLSLEDLVVKNDKEDLSQISFYSEMRQNQDETIVNVVRSTRKKYGDLQRTGNAAFSFTKMHTSLSELYQIGQKDSEGYTITMINIEWHPFHLLVTYYVTKYHNRESRQTVIDQTYRWRDNYAPTVLNRHENYSDYLVIYPPSATITNENTKIAANVPTVEMIFQFLLNETLTNYNTRATTALIRTDGMFEVDLETAGDYYGVLTPVSAYPLTKGFAFTFGFDSNLIAGDGIVQRGTDGSGNPLYYNQAVRYTNKEGRFSEFGFTILANAVLDTNDYETYPKINKTTLNDLLLTGLPYFYCGALTMNSAGPDALYVDKDPLTNYEMTYQLNVVPYNVGQYVLGQSFFTENYVVNNPNEGNVKQAYIYLYEDGTKYELLEDLKIKSGYVSQLILTTSNISYSLLDNQITFSGNIDLTDKTSWAIGDEDGNLYIACNENLNGWKTAKKHIRPGIKEIGNKQLT